MWEHTVVHTLLSWGMLKSDENSLSQSIGKVLSFAEYGVQIPLNM